jgi:hypothetical protein
MRAPAEAVVYTDPLCVQTIARLQHWIATCDKDHDNCKRLANPALPTRVLDVGTEGASQTVMLVETNGQSGKYIALSHCVRISSSQDPFLSISETLALLHVSRDIAVQTSISRFSCMKCVSKEASHHFADPLPQKRNLLTFPLMFSGENQRDLLLPNPRWRI